MAAHANRRPTLLLFPYGNSTVAFVNSVTLVVVPMAYLGNGLDVRIRSWLTYKVLSPVAA